MFSLEKSKQAFTEARTYMPGGVNSPVRSYRSVGGNPPFISSASGSRIYDIDGNEYIDYVLSWGPMILGHANPEIVASILEAIPRVLVMEHQHCLKQKWRKKFKLSIHLWKWYAW